MKGKRVLITGGSKGMGLAIARKCQSEGHKVMTLQRGPAEDHSIPSIKLDLTWPFEQIREATQEGIGWLGGIDWLVLAGGDGAFIGYLGFDPELAERLMRVNWHGPRYVLHSCMRSLRRNDDEEPSRVMWLGSTIVDPPGAKCLEDYAATKGAIHGSLASMARHYGKWGVRMTVFATSWVDTPMTQAIKAGGPVTYEKILKYLPLHRMASVEETSQAMYDVLAGPEYWHGSVIRFTGGSN